MSKRLLLGGVLLAALLMLQVPTTQAGAPQTAPLTDYWVVELAPGTDADAVAEAVGAVNFGPVGSLEGFYTFIFEGSATNTRAAATPLSETDAVLFFEQQVELERDFRDPTDPLYPDQWHLNNTGQGGGTPGEDANVDNAWDAGYTGSGVTIGIVEGGVEGTHPDLAGNYDAAHSYTVPGYGLWDHGTAVAGVAAANNEDGTCGVGAAYDAQFTSLDLLATDAAEATALSYALNVHDVYNNSWGPFDTGDILGAPGSLTQAAIQDGINNGRGGLGAIYVWAAGNGRTSDDDVNADGYANLPHTIAVGATTNTGEISFYSEHGSAMLVNAPSNGGSRSITTTDLTGGAGYAAGSCGDSFGGTSSASPLAAGVVALILDANPNLTWRDVQHILVETADQNDPGDGSWFTNGAGYTVSHDYGHGRIDAGAAVALAAVWENVSERVTYNSGSINAGTAIPDGSGSITETVSVSGQNIQIEHVELYVTATHPYRGDLSFELISPDGTTSVLLHQRPNDNNDGYNNWRMMSTHFWGENSDGEWTLRVRDNFAADAGTLMSWRLVIHGSEDAAPTLEAPTNLSVVGQTLNSIDLQWQDNAETETAYAVEATQDGDTWMEVNGSLPADTTTYTQVGLQACTSYGFRVRAYDSATATYSGYSNIAVGTTEGCLDAPTGLAAVPAGDTSVDLSWTDVSGETGYAVQVSTDGETWTTLTDTLAANTTTYTHTGLTACSRHYYQVSALNTDSGVASEYSDSVTVVTTGVCTTTVSNPGFEAPLTPDDWTLFAGGGAGLVYPYGASYEGINIMVLVPAPGVTYVQQPVDPLSGAPGDTVTLTFYLAGLNLADNGAVGARIRLMNDFVTGQAIVCGVGERGTFDWTPVTCTLTAEAAFNGVEVAIGLIDVTSGYLGIDSVAVEVTSP